MTTNPWLSAYMSTANRAYNIAAQSMIAQTRAATQAQQAQFKRDVLAAQRVHPGVAGPVDADRRFVRQGLVALVLTEGLGLPALLPLICAVAAPQPKSFDSLTGRSNADGN